MSDLAELLIDDQDYNKDPVEMMDEINALLEAEEQQIQNSSN